ncbi:efflux RND transporter periplasmic adaptor subunit [Paenalcaligenes hominis]|uniref:Multidrug efflux system membrane fusion protein n=1 Tax=Paenalcaligenes hominis TaxID=643674 RepID=A0ABX0WS87_9BURK|nr:efflux RND transporter periplasmic adaptor subunit [Paenalcaligenes hominis]NJB65597.1 multidrug efflux system membrane fusion protein [Paenalcaligenes hominis]GGE64503.1 secretion protein HlyD [Paenalcaligenes hominis]
MTEKNDHVSPKPARRWLWVLVVVVVVAGWYGWSQYKSTDSSSNARAAVTLRGQKTPVRTADVSMGVVEERLQAVGTVQAFNTVVVRSRVEGELIKLNFKDGQFVQAGAVLAEIDPRPYQAKLDQAQGQLRQIQAQLTQAKSDLARYTQLEKQQSIAKQQVDSQRALVNQLEGSVTSAQAAVDDAQLQLGYTQMTAPINGRLGLRNLDEGNLISAANTDGLVVITQTQPIAVSFALPENDLQRLLERLQLESELSVYVSDRQNKLVSSGSILAVDNQINLDTGTIRVKASMPNLDNRLFPNQFVSVSVLLANHNGLVVPSEAIQTGSIGDFVYVVSDDNQVAIRKVTVGLTTDERSLITAGLEQGEKVVVEGTDRLREGSQVEPINGTVNGRNGGGSGRTPSAS